MFDFFKKKKVTLQTPKIEEIEEFENIDAISKYFKDETGIDFDDQKSILKSKIITLCKLNHLSSFQLFLEKLYVDRLFKQETINYLTTNESFFYREFNQVASLVQKVIVAQKRVKILCAPCANGEEPYSIVIALFEAGVSPSKFHIVGIDISSKAIERSQKGVFNQKSTRNLSDAILHKYFSRQENIFILNDEVKAQVSFKRINIFDEAFADIGTYDYIFSRNMLIYFDHETKIKAYNILKKQLNDPSEEIFFGHADLPPLHDK